MQGGLLTLGGTILLGFGFFYFTSPSASSSEKIGPDTLPPALFCPADTILRVNSNCQAIYEAPSAAATDTSDPAPEITSSPLLPATFTDVGEHTITWIAVDSSGNADTCFQTVKVIDLTSPIITCPVDIILSADENGEASVPLTAEVEDYCESSVIITNDAPAVFRLGTTVVTFKAMNTSGNVSICKMKVTVKD